MTDPEKRNSARTADDTDEDTIELLLSPQELQSLSTVASDPHTVPMPVDPVDVPPCAGPAYPPRSAAASKSGLRIRWPQIPFEAAAVVAVTALALGSAAYRIASAPSGRTPDRLALNATGANTDSYATAVSESQGEPVRIRNPFDSSEIFEFPPGTSVTAARRSVANLLLERGRDRLERGHRNK